MGLASINKNMVRVIKNAHKIGVESDQAKIVIFSDLHRGTGDGADDFAPCELAYTKALEYYLENDFTLILLGDTEEFWECLPHRVLAQYKHLIELEGKFHAKSNLVKIWGNHDDQWSDPIFKATYNPKPFKGIRYFEGMTVELKDSNSHKEIELIFTHGHQGTLASDKFSGISRWFVRWFWRPFQQVFKFKLNDTPATNIELQTKHDHDMYKWAASRGNTILICGHTHQPVFMSNTHLDELIKRKNLGDSSVDEEIKVVQQSSTELNIENKIPCYFNTGCCSFKEGKITGIEISGGTIQLIKWNSEEGKSIKRSESFSKLYKLLS